MTRPIGTRTRAIIINTPHNPSATVWSEQDMLRLQALLTRQQAAYQAAMVGRTLPVLLEKAGRDPGQLVGKSPYLHAVHLKADPTLVGRVVAARVTAAGTNSLSGELAS